MEWAISIAYYVMYHSVYALFARIGVQSKIHSCTIEFCRLFLNTYLSKDNIDLLKKAHTYRNRVQYDIVKDEELQRYIYITDKALWFHLQCKQALEMKSFNEGRFAIRDALHSNMPETDR